MSILGWLAAIALAFALGEAIMFVNNLRHFKRPRVRSYNNRPLVSVVIPARNEAAQIEAAVRSVLASRHVDLEIIVVDDHSDDGTAEIVRRIAVANSVLRLVQAPPLPGGWCGKQHACFVGARHARHELLLFLDADVHLTSDAIASLVNYLDESRVDLVSGFPKQTTQTWMEKLLIPLIHFVLLAFLPIRWMRRTTRPAFAAGCGQLMMVRRTAYDSVGGHSAIRASLMDGITLPRALRALGHRTDIVDATLIAECRMYANARAVWSGLAKNAIEGMASPVRIVPFSLLLIVGQVLPTVLLPVVPWMSVAQAGIVILGMGFAYLPRIMSAIRFRQSKFGAALHPVGVLVLVSIQWYALIRRWRAKPSEWRGRNYAIIECAVTNRSPT